MRAFRPSSLSIKVAAPNMKLATVAKKFLYHFLDEKRDAKRAKEGVKARYDIRDMTDDDKLEYIVRGVMELEIFKAQQAKKDEGDATDS